MRLANVNGQEIGAVFVVVVHLHQITDLAAKRGSSVAAEDEDERTAADTFVQVEARLAIERDEARVRGRVADFEVAAMPLRQRVAQEAVEVPRAPHEVTAEAKGDREN